MRRNVNAVAAAAALLLASPAAAQVRNAVERAMVVAQEPELREPDFILKPKAGNGDEEGAKTLEEIEKSHILRVLEECGGNQTRAAEVLDIDRVTLHNKLKKYGWSKAAAATNGEK